MMSLPKHKALPLGGRITTLKCHLFHLLLSGHQQPWEASSSGSRGVLVSLNGIDCGVGLLRVSLCTFGGDRLLPVSSPPFTIRHLHAGAWPPAVPGVEKLTAELRTDPYGGARLPRPDVLPELWGSRTYRMSRQKNVAE